MDNRIGTQLDGRYLIEELIGVGGMANVYKGYDAQESRTIAIKMLRDEYAADETLLRRFSNETKAICSLNHDNIIKVYDVVLNADNPYIVMEYIDGETLKQYINRKGVITPKVVIYLVDQILLALEQAHENGIVHRDIKPQNIMVQKDGTVKVMDFGIARFAAGSTKTIHDGNALGSVHYVSPEQAKGVSDVDERTDIYSVGVMMYEMLTGQLPFDADNAISVAVKQIEQDVTLPRKINPDIPAALEEIVIKAMAKDRDVRYQSATQMLDDLEAYVRNPKITFGYINELKKYSKETKATKTTKSATNMSINDTAEKVKNKFNETYNATKQFVETTHWTKLKVLSAVALLCLMITFIYVSFMFIIYRPFKTVKDIECPNLAGIQYEQAVSEYKDVKIELVEESSNNNFEAGEIYEQEPIAGKTIKVNSTIKVKVSTGAETFDLPSYAGQEATSVYGKLVELGLYYETVEVNSDSIPEEYVVKTEPSSGETVCRGDTITVYISRGTGKQTVLVPDVLDKKIEKAKAAIEEAGLQVAVVYTQNSRASEGEVLSQTPVGNAKVPVGSTVTLTVASDKLSTSSVTIKFVPPNIDDEVLLTAKQDGMTVYSKGMVPSAERIVQVTLSGETSSTVEIYFGSQLYGKLLVDFIGGTYEWTENYADNF